jgi:short subunit dehydrogenase-like uncharacterized protein
MADDLRAPAEPDTPYDLVLFGATGFTGRLVAHHLARHRPTGCRWALAGRNEERLSGVRAELEAADPSLAGLPLLRADVTDAESMRALARSTRVVATTVGPYLQYGEPLVAACAEAGTDYLDLTGEPEFVDRMYLAHHERARETGARLVHCAGFDSIPYDLGVRFTVHQLPEGVPVHVTGMVTASGQLSGGTLHSALTAMSRARQMRETAARRRDREPRPAGRRVHGAARPPHRDATLGRWLVPLPLVDAQVVKRSAAALDRYGPDFTYGHYAGMRRLRSVVTGVAGVGALAAAAQVPPLRRRLMQAIESGDGPDAERRARAWFAVRFVGEGGGHRVVTEVSGGDPGYDETATMFGQAALCLAFDDNPPAAGQVTTAVAMGERLTDRLRAEGIRFDVLERG